MASQTTLQRIFTRRLLLLLCSFSVVMSTIIVLVYLHQTDKFNRAELASTLSHLKPRIRDQEFNWATRSENMLDVIEWAGLMNLSELQRNAKLQSFFTAQGKSAEFQGVAITDTTNGQVLFKYWHNSDQPDLTSTLTEHSPLWYDKQHATLYTKIKLSTAALGQNLNISFFWEWDSAMLNQISSAGNNIYIMLDNQPLLSSAGSLAMETTQLPSGGYAERTLDGFKYLEDNITLKEVSFPDGRRVPLKLVLRTPVANFLPIPLVLVASIGITLLFGFILFMIFGQWLRRLGTRLDALTNAALHFQQEPANGITAETTRLLQLGDANKHDQISVVAQALSTLMASAAQRDEEQRGFLQTLDLLQDAVIEISTDGRLLHATEAWQIMTDMEDLASCTISKCVHPADSAALMEQLRALIYDQKEQVSIRFRMQRQRDSSSHYWVEGRFAAVRHNNIVTSIRGVVRDISNTYLQERQIRHMALHDALTDLPNRVLLEDRMAGAINRAARSNYRVALGFIDLDHFKQVNDNFGHKIGDRLLKEVTHRLQSALRSTDTLSRWGGDEFVVLCPDLSSLEDARELTLKLSLLTREHITIDGTDFPFTFSAGFAVYPDDAGTSEMLLAQADRAMFFAKAQGRNNIQFFNAIAGKESGRQSFHIQSRLVQAINNGNIQCWLQPIISAQTGKVVGMEALARWHESEQGWIPPSVFIPMAESLGLIDKVGQSVWQHALQALTLLPDHLRLSVNLSKRQLFSSTIVQQLCDDVARANIEPGRIMLEITESIALSDVAYARERIVELDAQGFGISIDDFGVGYSSLSQLHEIPADELKLDISFIKRIHVKSGFSMATAIILIAKSLNLECVAEGVEDAITAELLRNMGVEMLQGYHFAHPMPIDDYLAWLDARINE